MSSNEDREESAPLVYSLQLDRSCEDPLAQRSSSISNGAGTILSRWPTNISQPTRAILGVLAVIIIVVITVLIMYSFTTALVPAAFPIPRAISKRSTFYCDHHERGYGLTNVLMHSNTETSLKPNEKRIFFIKSHGESLTEGNICALKSAAREGRVVLLVVLPTTMAREEEKIVGEIHDAGLDGVLDVVVADPASYFSETPLGGYGEDDGSPGRRELKNFAFKVATVWRFAGAVYDLDIVTLKAELPPAPSESSPSNEPGILPSMQVPEIVNRIQTESTDSWKEMTTATTVKPEALAFEPSKKPEDQTMAMEVPINTTPGVSTSPVPRVEGWTWDHSDKMAVDANATVSYDGAILVAKQPCQAFVFALMRELMEIDLRGEHATVATVVERALNSFCGLGSRGCNGVKVITQDRLCSKVSEQCAWTRVGGEDSDFDWKQFCP